MSLRPEWFIVCERVINDTVKGTLTLVDCLEEISAPTFPAFHPRFAFAAIFSRRDDARQDAHYAFRLMRLGEDGSEEQVYDTEGPVAALCRRVRLVQTMSGIRLLKAERVTFRVDWREGDGEWMAGLTYNIDVKKADEEADAPLPAE